MILLMIIGYVTLGTLFSVIVKIHAIKVLGFREHVDTDVLYTLQISTYLLWPIVVPFLILLRITVRLFDFFEIHLEDKLFN